MTWSTAGTLQYGPDLVLGISDLVIRVDVYRMLLTDLCQVGYSSRNSQQVQVAHYQTFLITGRFVTVYNQIKVINQTTNEIIYFVMFSSSVHL